MATLDDIPADVEMEMDETLQRLFRAAGCDPACHVCGEGILPPAAFLLVSYYEDEEDKEDGELTDQMVCAICGRPGLEALFKQKVAAAKERADWFKDHPNHHTYGRGYSRPSNVTR